MPANVEGSPLAAFDQTGLVYGVSAAMTGGEGYVSSHDIDMSDVLSHNIKCI